MLSVRLPKELEERIENLAKITKRPKSFFVREALYSYIEDLEDYYEAKKRENDPNRELISLKELEVALGLQDRD